MTAENKCPHCGKPVPATALGGICPECMLKAGLADTGEVGPGGAVVAKPSRPAPPVEEIAPHFPQLEILECLGRGGMGAVYKARQPKLDRFVALKILTRDRAPGISDTEFAARFQQEARALARITHPDIVAVYDFGEAGGYHYLLMEFVDGLTLRQLLQTRKLSPEQALSIVPKICEALQFAHERGIVHRDIKPENILLDKQGRVKIADFGIAKIVGPEASSRGLTGAKDVIGTPHYMAPEQVEKPLTVDHRADIYSLGVVFYEMLTGELPLGKFQSPSRMVHVDVRLDEVVLHALEKNPDRRYQHASEVKTDVERIAASPGSRRSESVVETASKTETSCAPLPIEWGGVIRAGAILFFILAAALVLGWFASKKSFSLPASLGAVLAVATVVTAFGGWLVSSAARMWRGDAGRFTSSMLPELLPGEHVVHFKRRVWAVFNYSPPLVCRLFFSLPPLWEAGLYVTDRRILFVAQVLGVFGQEFSVWFNRNVEAGQRELLQRTSTGKSHLLGSYLDIRSEAPQRRWYRGRELLLRIYTRQPELLKEKIAAANSATAADSGKSATCNLQSPVDQGVSVSAAAGKITGAVAAPNIWLAYLSLALFLTGLLGTILLIPLISQDEWALIFGGVALLLALVFGALSWAERLSKAVVTATLIVFAGAGIAVVALVWTPPWTRREVEQRQQETLRRAVTDHAREVAAAAAKSPPVVIATVPESGAADVDPSLDEVRVTFSKDMITDRMWSFVQVSNETFPKSNGQIHYLDDKRTCVLPVQLESGKVYAIWINSDNHHAFQDRDGRSAMPYLLIFETRR